MTTILPSLALSQVLNTEELLEEIILCLPIKDILLKVPLVCKAWHATTQTSPRIRQALFFDPVPCKKSAYLDPFWAEDEGDERIYSMIANPWFKLLFGWTRGKTDETSERFRYFSREPSASWRRMLVSQPPRMMRYCLGYDEWCYDPKRLKPGQGMRFSDLECADCLLVANDVYKLTEEHEFKGKHLWSEVEYGSQVMLMPQARAG
ncbi:hypothetical protein LTR56_010846 [Elasticomyces elasticus]|nr:hypothetical protein LTR56_010846 [Elasticomyces elasticus]KAK4932292.1 hypothetical protein LTR49_001161 [Elasticomyces elasticus]KAK5768300.1 hypothetical protein LTS12_001439 [Elasticomyces elasticus]